MTPADERLLRLLSHLHYAAAALVSVIPLFATGYGALALAIALREWPNLPATVSEALGWIPVLLSAAMLLLGVAAMGANLLTAVALRNRTHRTLCLLTAALNCLQFPLGTLLAAVSLAVLSRPGVRAAFEAKAAATEPVGRAEVFPSSPQAPPGFPPPF